MSHWDQELTNEQERVNVVVEKVDKVLDELHRQVGLVKAEIISLRKNFWEDVTVNIDNIKEMVETAASIRQEAEILTEREHTHRHAQNQYQLLKRLKDAPYFGRIDFLETGDLAPDQIYLGIGSFYDKETKEFLVHDWRAPISSLYYDYSLGLAKYEAPVGTIYGELLRKRQFMIRNGQITSMFDTGITIGDELLQKILGRNASAQMKSIVATVQMEQNQVIRNEKSSLLLVQGAAGSGKTSAALQRIAFLLYRYRDTIVSDHILLFSPNPMFNDYISNVLPELGEENMQQTTFQQYVEHMIGDAFHVEDPFTQLEYLLSSNQDASYKTRIDGIIYKSSIEFMSHIEHYVKKLGHAGMRFHDITFRGKTIIPSTSIEEYFYTLDSSIPMPLRMQFVTEWILEQLKRMERQEAKSEWVEQEIQYMDKDEMDQFYIRLSKDKRLSDSIDDDFEREHELLCKYVVSRHFSAIRKQVTSLAYLNSIEVFQRLFESVPDHASVPSNWNEICNQTKRRFQEKQLANEDATPYLFLTELLEGRKTNTHVRFVFIDEAQDYSPFQLAFIRRLFPKAKWTILGDINQSIFAHAGNPSLETIASLFPDEKAETIRLSHSYRSTRQITEFTRHVLANEEAIQAFNRDGQKPLLIKVQNKTEQIESVVQRVKHLQNDGYKTIAIICKTAKESKEAAKQIGEKLDVRLVEKESVVYEQGIAVIPVYLAKGIEFDAVIIFEGSRKIYSMESERKLFYTACTRAMHELSIHYVGEITPFVSTVPEQCYRTAYQNRKGRDR